LSPTGPSDAEKRLSQRLLSPSSTLEWDFQQESYIKQWLDFSVKYGIAYTLTNEICGVYFNDNSKIVLHPDNINFDYFEKGIDGKDVHESQNLTNYAPDLKKKVTLLIHFKNYMEGNENKTQKPTPDPRKRIKNSQLVYVKRWLKTKHAILFRLSNKVV
jgi:polo-like kinase 1